MIYEAQVSYEGQDKTGNPRTIKENYLMDDFFFFKEVESYLYDVEFVGVADVVVCAIKRSRIKEIACGKRHVDDSLWLAELEDMFITDEGEERPIRYKVAFFANSFDDAKTYISEYIKQGYNMSLVSLKKTKFSDVLTK